jgi:hypothetical protein
VVWWRWRRAFVFVHVLCNGKCECHAVVTGYCNDSLFMPLWRSCVKICRELDRVGTGGVAWPALTTSFGRITMCTAKQCATIVLFASRRPVLNCVSTQSLTRAALRTNWISPSALFLFSQHCAFSRLRPGSTFEFSEIEGNE